MSHRKGLSHEEKRQKMMELFYEKKDFFQLKELEKIGPKEKGVISQAVKDVVQSLVDDGMVDTEKIGTSVYFWAFPSKAFNTRKRKLDDMDCRLQDLNTKVKISVNKVEQGKNGREEDEARMEALASLRELQETQNELQMEIQKYCDSDPEVLAQIKEDSQVAHAAANRWTDNVFNIKSWCKNKFHIEEEMLNKQFNIPEELDYI